MRVIVLASQKGGAGKTTLSRHLAVEAERRGAGPVALIDCDSQGGLARWWNRRKAETPAFISTTLTELPDTLSRLSAAGYGIVVIDTPPAVGETIRTVISRADLVVIPARPSPDDLDAVGATVDLVEEMGKPMIFVVNGATKKARLTGQAAVVLSQHGTVAPVNVHHSVAFPSSAIGGLTVGEADPSGSPATELTALWTYVAERLDKLAPPQESSTPSKLASKQVMEAAR